MALIQCPECGKEVSDQAEQCIHCGYPLKQKENKEKLYIIEVLKVGENEEDVVKIVQEASQLEHEKAIALVKCGRFPLDHLTYYKFKETMTLLKKQEQQLILKTVVNNEKSIISQLVQFVIS